MPRALAVILLVACATVFAPQSTAPSVAFVARWGGASKDLASAIALDRQHVYVAGSTYSPDFPTTTAGARANGNWCAFATKLSAESGAVEYSTALCTNDMTFAFAAALAPDGELWVAGSTDGGGLPVTSDAAQRTYGGSSRPTGSGDAMLIRWSADGRTLRYATYYGGSGDERANALVADADGGVWMAGKSGSDGGFLAHYDVRGALTSSTVTGAEIVAMARVDADRLALVRVNSVEEYATAASRSTRGWIAGAVPSRPSTARFRAVSALPSGALVLVGESADCRDAHGREDGWIVAHSPARDAMVERCLGGSGVDQIHGVAPANDGTVWITGLTGSGDFPVTTTGPGTQPDYDTQAFVARVDPATGAIRFATLLGADANPRRDISRGYAVAVAADGSLFATGETTGGRQLLPTSGAFNQRQTFASTDVYLVKLR
jgi:hypothetical protein